MFLRRLDELLDFLDAVSITPFRSRYQSLQRALIRLENSHHLPGTPGTHRGKLRRPVNQTLPFVSINGGYQRNAVAAIGFMTTSMPPPAASRFWHIFCHLISLTATGC
jgi:hypothetical protein